MNRKGITVAVAMLVLLAACEKTVPPPESVKQAENTNEPAEAGSGEVGIDRNPENSPVMYTGQFLSGEIIKSELCAIRVNNIPLSNKPTLISDETTVLMRGWFGDDQTMAWPSGAVLYMQRDEAGGKVWSVTLPEPLPRGDVARNFKSETMRNTGFEITRSLTALPPGNYRLVLGFDKDGKHYRCDRSRIIQLD